MSMVRYSAYRKMDSAVLLFFWLIYERGSGGEAPGPLAPSLLLVGVWGQVAQSRVSPNGVLAPGRM